MALDTALVLDPGQVVTVDGNTDYIECEGGFMAWAEMQWGVLSGGSTTCDARVQFSTDNGTNYYMAAKFQQAGPTDDSKFDRKPCYIPQPDTAGDKVRVRINYDVAGSSPSYAVTRCMLNPIISNAPPALDELIETGAALQMAAV